MPAREGRAPRDVAGNLFADCTKSDGDSAPRALAAPVYARMRKGDAPWLVGRRRRPQDLPRPPAAASLWKERASAARAATAAAHRVADARPRAAAARPHDAEPAAAAGRAADAARAEPLLQPGSAIPRKTPPKPLPARRRRPRGADAGVGPRALTGDAINRTGSPVRLVGGIGLALHDPLPVGSIDQNPATTRAIELAAPLCPLARCLTGRAPADDDGRLADASLSCAAAHDHGLAGRLGNVVGLIISPSPEKNTKNKKW